MSGRGALLGVLAVFGCGVFAGFLGARFVEAHHPTGIAILPASGHGEAGIRSVTDFQLHLEELSRELDLDAEQRQAVAAVLDDARERGRALHLEVIPLIEAYLDATRDEIRAVLDPAQRQRLDALHREHRRAFHRFLIGHSGGDGEHHGSAVPHP
ncbi:MAG: hypothetical protein DWQ36_08135 [Acidobacteria bacterium]|nr:MAG: hypothetical protein DWQ30_01860 [Acidobacteriota bacterium]REK08777.1 MAG: hypothetical protein DWQ36_08135 [Acidobacteriota bacterium]